MMAKLFAGFGVMVLLSGCGGVLVVERPHHRPPPVVVYAPPPVVVAPPAPVIVPPRPPVVVVQPAPVVVAPPAPVVVAQPAPVIVEEGAMVGGVVVVEPVGVAEYVLINGGWYYWHPGMRVWIHAHRAANWRPPGGARVYHGWAEHPMYHH